MNLKSILGGKTQDEIDEIIRDSNSALHVHMKNCNTQASSWITVNDLINAIEQRLLESPNVKTKLVTRNALSADLKHEEVEICDIGSGFFDDEDGGQFVLVATEYANEEEGSGREIDTSQLLLQLKSKADIFGNWPVVSVTDQFTTPDGTVIRSHGTNNFPYLIWHFAEKALWLLESPEEQWPEYKNPLTSDG
jgi:hypothetical protein